VRSGFWNVNGWSINTDSENFHLRKDAVNLLNLDILGIAETHLTGNNTIDMPGFTWFGIIANRYI